MSRLRMPIEQRILTRFRPLPNGCWIWTGDVFKGTGYGRVSHEGRGRLVHRLAWQLFRYPLPRGRMVLHSCDTKLCINFLDHLYDGTRIDNARDAVFRGQYPRGERLHNSTLTEKVVRQVRYLYRNGVKVKAMAEIFGCGRHAIYKVVAGKTWRHIDA